MTVFFDPRPELERNPFRLGRHVRHDSRSREFAVSSGPTSTLVSKRWTRRIPVLDQGDVGSCTGNAAAGWLGTDDATRQGVSMLGGKPVDEAMAVAFYSAATELDSAAGAYPPDDTGSDGLSVAKALQNAGACTGYQHAFSLSAALTALQSGPVMFGVDWYEAMFDPAADGRLSITGQLAGGHEFVVDEIDVPGQRVWLTNSWGPSWGMQGRAYLTYADAVTLLRRDGDVTVPTPISVGPPAPVPPQPVPADADATLWAAAKDWAAAKGLA